MARPISKVAPDWWDYTTLDPEIYADVPKLNVKSIEKLSRPGFKVVMYDTLEDSTWPRRSNTSTPGVSRRLTTRPASAGRSVPQSNCRWWLAS